MARTRKDDILDVVSDLVTNFLYYDRKEDEHLPRGAIEAALEDGSITREDILLKFADELDKGCRK